MAGQGGGLHARSDLSHPSARYHSTDTDSHPRPQTRSGPGSATAALPDYTSEHRGAEPGHRVCICPRVAYGKGNLGHKLLLGVEPQLLSEGRVGDMLVQRPASFTRSRTVFWLSPNAQSVLLPMDVGLALVGLL